MSNYKTYPEITDKIPKVIPYIVTNEAAERFSFYVKCLSLNITIECS